MITFLENWATRTNTARRQPLRNIDRKFTGIPKRERKRRRKKTRTISPDGNVFASAFVCRLITLCVNFRCQMEFFRATKLCNDWLTESEQNAFPFFWARMRIHSDEMRSKYVAASAAAWFHVENARHANDGDYFRFECGKVSKIRGILFDFWSLNDDGNDARMAQKA